MLQDSIRNKKINNEHDLSKDIIHKDIGEVIAYI